jgi:hypothetical protein
MKMHLTLARVTWWRSWLLVGLLFFAVAVRWVFVHEFIFPFNFDHGKDLLGTMAMVETHSPKFIGPWTSIPGVFFGPAWYYLLAPAYILGSGSPFAPIVVMLLLMACEVYLAYRIQGWVFAVIVASNGTWMSLAKSAWNPFPMPLLTLLVVYLLQWWRHKLDQHTHPKHEAFLVFLVWCTASFGFHFSAAFAIFYPILLCAAWFIWKLPIRSTIVAAAVIGFLVPFTPQLIFEVRHDFLETRSLIAYFQKPEPHAATLEKAKFIFKEMVGYQLLSMTPNLPPNVRTHATVVLLWQGFFSLLCGVGWWKQRKQQEARKWLWFFSIAFVVPLIGFWKLHFNVWYLLAVFPLASYFFAKGVQGLPKPWVIFVICACLLSPIFDVIQYLKYERVEHSQSRAFITPKLQAVEFILRKTNNGQTPFASYHYVPDIYDFTYQYLYLWLAKQRHIVLPVEFAYEPHTEQSYFPEKAEIMMKLPDGARQNVAQHPKLIFYIVENPEQTILLDMWWGRQRFSRIVETTQISPEVVVYQAEP